MTFNKQGGLTFAVITLIIALVSYYLACVLNSGSIVGCASSFFDNLTQSKNLWNYAIQFALSFVASGFLFDWTVDFVANTTAKLA